MRKCSPILVLTLLLFATNLVLFSHPSSSQASPEESPINYEEIVQALDVGAVTRHIEFLSNLTTRATGYSGNQEAAKYIFDTFVDYNLSDVRFYNFSVVDAVSYGANITVLSPTNMFREIYPFVPNLVSPSTIPPGGMMAHLIYAKDGHLSDFNGKNVDESIVLMDFNSGEGWINAVGLGAKAVIFIPPVITVPEELESKHINLPLHFPRFWIRSEDADALLTLLEGGEPVQVRLESTVRWQRMTGRNVIAFVRGTQYADQYIMLTSYYDSYSIAPSLAPGAQEACGIAGLLELAKYLHKNPPKYSIVFVAYGGHHQGLRGAEALREEYFYPGPSWDTMGKKIILHINLDLSTGSQIPYFTYYGSYHGLPLNLDPGPYIPLTKYHKQIHDWINQEKPGGRTYMALDESMGWHLAWTMPTDTRWYWYDSEVMVNMGLPGYTFTTVFDKRQYYGTPQDTLDKMNYENLQTQLEYTYCAISKMLNTENLKETHLERFNYEEAHSTGRFSQRIRGILAQYSEQTGWYEPIPDVTPIVICEKVGWSGKGTGGGGMTERGVIIRLNHYQVLMTDGEGRFEFSDVYSHWVSHRISAWVINSTTGHVMYALDSGPRQYASNVVHLYGYPPASGEAVQMGWLYVSVRDMDVIDFGFINLFECGSIFITDNIDPRSLSPTSPFMPGAAPPQWRIVERDTLTPHESYLASRLRSMVMMFVPAKKPSLYFMDERYPSAIMVNSTPTIAEAGYTLVSGQQLIMKNAPLVFAKSAYHVNAERIATLQQYGLSTEEVLKKHQQASTCLAKAQEALENMEYDRFYTHAVTAWRLENEVYMETRPVIEDTAAAVPFFASLLIPFIFLVERLVFGWKGMKRIAALIIIFASTTGLVAALHPGFVLAASPILVIIAFTILVLVSPILIAMASHIHGLFKAFREKFLGAHYADISRISAVMVAFSVGIRNVRKRKLRSGLVFLSVVIMTAGVITLTSMSTLKVSRALPIGGSPLYDGLYIHSETWGYELGGPLSPELVTYLQAQYLDVAVVVPRAWYYTLDSGVAGSATYHFWIHHQGRNITAYCIMGITDREPEVSKINHFVAGRTFIPTDRNTMILSQQQAERLGITNTTLPAKVSMFSLEYTVVGIIDKSYMYLQDLDGERITPLMLNIPENPFNIHASADEVIILPYWDVVALGKGRVGDGGIRSVSLKFKDPDLILPAAKDLILLFPSLPVYANSQGQIYLYSAAQELTTFGFQYQLVPMILIFMVILNVMLGTVYERKREIATYSSVGLSPLHVAFMFLSESSLYAVVGGVIGYVVAMIMVKATATLALGVLFLNYSSMWAVVGVGISMLIILISSIYPMLLSARLVTPSVERVWKIPTRPFTDRWAIPLPVTITTATEVGGVISYLEEFLRAHMAERAEDFAVRELTIKEGETEGKEYKGLVTEMALTPYEKGIQQTTSMAFTLEPKDRRWHIELQITRRSGGRRPWIVSNRTFADMVRKHLLIWTSLSSIQKKIYIKRFQKVKQELTS